VQAQGSPAERVPVGFAFAALRRDAGVAQEDLARRLGITRESISLYESGKIVPSYTRVRRMLALLGHDFHDLQDMLDRIEERPRRPRRKGSSPAVLEEAFLEEAEGLFRRWERRLSAVQQPLLRQTESEVMEALRRLLHGLGDQDVPG